MLLVASETGHVYTFATDKLQPMITSEIGKNLIQNCLSFDDGTITPEAAAAMAASPSINSYDLPKISIENYNQNDLEIYDDYESSIDEEGGNSELSEEH